MAALLLLFSLLAFCTREFSATEIQVVQTCRDTPDKLTAKPSLQFSYDVVPSASDLVVSINSSTRFQTIVGFGGAFTEASAYLFSLLTQEQQNFVLNAYWAESGLNYKLGRITIGSCDYAQSAYNYDENSGDFSLQQFSIDHDKQVVIPFIKQAISTSGNTLQLVATPWSPPAWMKTNNNMYGSGTPCLKPDSNGNSYQATWSNYISKFIQLYKDEGIPVWAITPQNEPENYASWEACVWTAVDQGSFIKNHLGPTLHADHPDVKLLMYDHNRDHIVSWANTILSDPQASQYVDGVAFHSYNGFLWEQLQITHNNFPSKFLIGTESAKCRLSPYQWYWGEEMVEDMIGDLNSWSVGFIDWNLIVDTNGGPNHGGSSCNALLMYNRSSSQIFVNPGYYAVGQITKFVPAGSQTVWNSVMTRTSSGMFAASFLTPSNQVLVVVQNMGNSAQSVVLKKEDGQSARYEVLGHSVTTFMYSN